LGGDPVSLVDLAKQIIAVNMGDSYELVPFPPEQKVIDIGSYYGDYSKIRLALGWEPKISLQSGLEKALSYYRKKMSRYL